MQRIYFILIVIIGLVLGCTSSSTLISFNIRYNNPKDKENSWDNRKLDILSFIENYNPDILGIQEGSNYTVSWLNESLANYQYIGIGNDGKTGGEYTAIFYDTTKYKVIENTTFWLSQTPNKSSIGWDASAKRICTYATFVSKRGKDTLHVFNTHFDHRGNISKKKSAELIIKKIDELDLSQKKVVVMGDLNSRQTDESISTMNNALDDGIEISKASLIGPKGTFNFFNRNYTPLVRIDYIFTKNLKVLNYKHLSDRRKNGLWLSDHLPILIEIEH
jgi:endonuclease/exonuclease/phosphatase family metal-dependent hydrolase